MNSRQAYRLEKTIVLVGMMGCGKSSIGRRLAARLGLEFKDADNEIEQAAGMRIPEIFETHGEDYFRAGERRVIERLLCERAHILAAGGGAFCNPRTHHLIKEKAFSIWLNVELKELLRRVKKRPGSRPLLKRGTLKETLQQLLIERVPYYAQADLTITRLSAPREKTIEAMIAELIECGIVKTKGV